jgi:hypothetical protein
VNFYVSRHSFSLIFLFVRPDLHFPSVYIASIAITIYDIMKYGTAMVALAGLASARNMPLYSRKFGKREVPLEHSHRPTVLATNTFLQLDNPLNIVDPIFALLGNAAAIEGAPEVDNLDCLQQIVADQAFTNAKAAGDLEGMTQAILFRALERNTVQVGLASVLCDQVAVNPEIAAISQHQDPASPEAINNAAIELAVAQSLASIGADPLIALQSATFPPGEVSSPNWSPEQPQVLTLSRLVTRRLRASPATTTPMTTAAFSP